MDVHSIISLFKRYEFRFGNELQLQDQIAEMLVKERLNFLREVPLDAKSRPDFLFSNMPVISKDELPLGMIALEVKVDGGQYGVLEQIQRYISHYTIDAVIVVSSKRFDWKPQFLMEGKPIHYVPVRSKFIFA